MSGIRNSSELTLNLSLNVNGDSNDENDFFFMNYYWLIYNFQSFLKLFENNSSVNLN